MFNRPSSCQYFNVSCPVHVCQIINSLILILPRGSGTSSGPFWKTSNFAWRTGCKSARVMPSSDAKNLHPLRTPASLSGHSSGKRMSLRISSELPTEATFRRVSWTQNTPSSAHSPFNKSCNVSNVCPLCVSLCHKVTKCQSR